MEMVKANTASLRVSMRVISSPLSLKRWSGSVAPNKRFPKASEPPFLRFAIVSMADSSVKIADSRGAGNDVGQPGACPGNFSPDSKLNSGSGIKFYLLTL
jgi:hypothetical protein